MSLAELFFLKERLRRSARRWRQARFRQRAAWASYINRQASSVRSSSSQVTGHASRFLLEAIEPRLLMSATPTELVASPQLEPAAVTVPQGNLPSLDIDLNGQADALSDGILIIRHLFGFTGNALATGVVDPTGQRTDPTAIQDYLTSITSALDVDLNGQPDALSDGIVIIRSLFGFTGAALTTGAIDPAGLRTDSAAIAAFLDNINPQRELVAPLLTTGLQQDTGLSLTDTVTFNPTITGTIADINQISAFTAGFDAAPPANFMNVLGDLLSTGVFTFSTARMNQLAGGALADGTHMLHLRATDARGNVATLDRSFTLDTGAPLAPVLDLLAASDTGASSTDNVTNVVLPGILVSVTDTGRLRLVQNGVTTLDTALVSPTVTYTPGAPLANSITTLTATLEDLAGNVSAASLPLAIRIDTVAPIVPVFDLDPSSDTPPLGDQTTLQSLVTLRGTAEPLSSLLFSSGGPPLATATADAQGTFLFTNIALALGANALTVQSSDLAGNTSSFNRIIARVAPSLSIGNVSVTEGNAGAKLLTFTVNLSAPSGQTVTANYATADGTATSLGPNADFVAKTGTLTFNPGVTSQAIDITVNGDARFENDETFTLALSNAVNAVLPVGPATGTITNDDAAPVFSINNVTQTEGNAGTTAVNFTVTLTGLTDLAATVVAQTANGTATAGSDYAAAGPTTLTFAPGGPTTQTFTVNVNGDVVFENNETFLVNLTGPSNATISGTAGSGTGTITNDDAAPTFTINDITLAEGNAGTTAFTFTITKTGLTELASSVQAATADGVTNPATAGSDYVTVPLTTLNFAAGVATQTVTVTVNGDTTVEANETFVVNLTNPTNATIADNQGLGTITNDDQTVNQPPVVNDQTFSVAENSPNGTVVGTIVSTDPDAGQTRSIAITGGTGQAAFAVSAAGVITVANSALLNFETTPSFTLNVTVTDNGTPQLSDTAIITINLSNVNEKPALTAPATASVPENTTTVATVTANDPDAGTTLSFSLSGVDAAKFQLTGTGNSRTLSFVNAPDFETPTDVGTNNVYDVTVSVSDGTLSESQAIAVTVTDVNEGGQQPFVIRGTDRGDKIIVEECRDGQVTVIVNDKVSRVQLQKGQEIQVLGLGGDDHIILKGLNRNALVDGGDGNDKINARGVINPLASLTLLGGKGCDVLIGGAGNDFLKGGDGNDILKGRKGNDNLDGGLGNDILIGGPGLDVLIGGGGHDTLIQGSRRDDHGHHHSDRDDDHGRKDRDDDHDRDGRGHDRGYDNHGKRDQHDRDRSDRNCQPPVAITCSRPWVKDFVGAKR